MTFSRIMLAVLVALATSAACGDSSPAPQSQTAAPEYNPWLYEREYLFLGDRAGAPLAVPIAFSARRLADGIDRGVRGWLAHGEVWDGFLDEAWESTASDDVWRVLPRGPLRIAAGGPSGIESLWLEAGERRLFIELGAPSTGWLGTDRHRFRLLDATLTLGQEELRGTVLEEMQTRRALADREGSSTAERILLTAGDSLVIFLVEQPGTDAAPAAWLLSTGEEHAPRAAVLRWTEGRTVEAARRDIPLAWRFEVPGADITGELGAIGEFVEVGVEERGGRRPLAARYTVSGWIARRGDTTDVAGTVRHEQW
jgi:hypothetical protein